ncbi:MAG: translation initiation factor IF-2 N-terminal domain-containing protein, partial [Actinomycetota bacterium]|nr:translation initiation factor IF-2 N-terminal domain-containing protein [Actinomycetota bacterium]
MANTTAPARGIGGRTAAPASSTFDGAELAATLPDKLRVHALAKLLAVSSKDVMAALGELGVAVRSAQSSIDRDTAVRAMQMLLPEPEPESTEIDEVGQQGAPETPVLPTLHPARPPIFNAAAPVFLPPAPQPTGVEQFDV